MPPEPKKPIEEMLEASARARRAEFGADPQMPNPLRVRLHEEIARQNRAEESGPRRSWLSRFWPQISLATAVAAVLVTASLLWFRPQRQVQGVVVASAETEPFKRSDELRSLESAPNDRLAKNDNEASPATPSAESASAYAHADEKKSSEEGEVHLAVQPAAAAPADATAELGSLDSESIDRLAKSEDANRAAPMIAAAPLTARSFAPTRQLENSNQGQRFSQNIAGQMAGHSATRTKQRANVLNTFDIQQEGNRIRVVDEDGSTYTGKLEQISQKDSRSLSQKNQQNFASGSSAAAKPKEEAESNEYFFRAAGFNSSLKKNVVFEANYIAPSAENRTKADRSRKQQNEQSSARIIGTAKISGEPPVEVDAVAVTR